MAYWRQYPWYLFHYHDYAALPTSKRERGPFRPKQACWQQKTRPFLSARSTIDHNCLMATSNDIIKKSFFGLCGLTSAAHGRCRMTRIQASSEKDDAKISRHVERTWYLSTFAILLRLVSFWRGNVHHSLAMVVSSSSLYFQVRQVSILTQRQPCLAG